MYDLKSLRCFRETNCGSVGLSFPSSNDLHCACAHVKQEAKSVEKANPVCTCVAQCQSYEEDQGDEKVARTDEKSQNQVIFCPLWVEGWRSRRVRVLRYLWPRAPDYHVP